MIMTPIKERMSAMSTVDDLEDIKDLIELLYMAGAGCGDTDDGRAVRVGATIAVKMVEDLIAKIEAAG